MMGGESRKAYWTSNRKSSWTTKPTTRKMENQPKRAKRSNDCLLYANSNWPCIWTALPASTVKQLFLKEKLCILVCCCLTQREDKLISVSLVFWSHHLQLWFNYKIVLHASSFYIYFYTIGSMYHNRSSDTITTVSLVKSREMLDKLTHKIAQIESNRTFLFMQVKTIRSFNRYNTPPRRFSII